MMIVSHWSIHSKQQTSVTLYSRIEVFSEETSKPKPSTPGKCSKKLGLMVTCTYPGHYSNFSNCIWVRIHTEHSISYNSWYIIKLHLPSSLFSLSLLSLSHTHTHTYTWARTHTHNTCHMKQHNIPLEGMLICTSHTALQTATSTCKLTSEMYTEAIYMSRTQI